MAHLITVHDTPPRRALSHNQRRARSAFALRISRHISQPVPSAIATPIPSRRYRYAPPTAGRFDVQYPDGRSLSTSCVSGGSAEAERPGDAAANASAIVRTSRRTTSDSTLRLLL